MPFTDINLEKLYIYNKFLYKKLPSINNPLPFNVLEDIDMDSYKIADKTETNIFLTEDGKLSPASDKASQYTEEEKAKLSYIIKTLNDTFGTEFTEDDKVFIERLKENMKSNEDLKSKVKNNPKENVEEIFPKYFDKEINKLIKSNFDLYKKVNDNKKLRYDLSKAILDWIYKDMEENE